MTVKIMKVVKFFRDVKKELSKVTWLTPKETSTSSLMVVTVVLVFSLLFLLADFVIFHAVQFFMNLGV